MSEMEYWKLQHMAGKISRREFVGRSAALGASTAAIAAMVASVEAHADETPKKGGTLKAGIGGGSTTDSLNPASYTDSVALFAGFALYNGLVENGPDNKLIPELAETFEAKPGATDWVFNLRKGVTFTNGKTFDADDAIYSLNLHRGDTKSGAAGPMKAVSDVKKLGPNQIQVSLSSPDADFAYVLSDYHMLMVPNGFTDWANPVGTGAFKLNKYDPGVRVSLLKNPNFWKKDRGYLDGLEATVINDSSARINALVSGQVDVINRVDPKAIALLKKSPNLQIVQAAGGYHSIITMMIDRPPFDNADIRQALKHAIDREQILKAMFSGYGSVGNDHPIPKSDPYFNTELPQTKYDPEKAKFYFKKAGLTDPSIVLQASDAAFSGAVDMATLFQASASKADIKIDVKKESADGFWENVWLKGAFVTSYWGGRPAATQMFGVAYKSDAPWNETHWNRPAFDKLLADARSELDEAKRKKYIWAMQEMVHNEGGSLIPAFRDWLDAHNNKVGGHTPHFGFDLDNGRLAEKAWLKS
ncbi:ABC transporter substrate-binding protein [Methylovirgula sp. 4M-Z18]|uniref:ABC transporter substrate-binding protein n=1 Tax=Methylovirgula sp. 4M-Z18 TaxID=2293567 RepID=UPI000E2F9E91|nr:ABC transporter substrate-binding protein [Methylovirgula sp. 4M-Z18]RFB81002.1 ABC transporter substrate-binding protein [Methylovirgula sp. 4M-Z18]